MKINAADLKKMMTAMIAAMLVFVMLVPAEPAFAKVKTYKQKKYALAKYRTKNYKPVKNKKLKPLNVRSSNCYKYTVYDYTGAWVPHLLPSKSCSTKKMDMQTMFYLPKQWKNYDLGNPQSLSVTPDGKTAYLTYVFGSKGRIFKFDLARMRELELNVPGKMGTLRMYGRYPGQYENFAPEMESCVKIGPAFKMGHGSAFAYNPKDKHLWFVTETNYKSKKKIDVMHMWRVNMKTLKPELKVDFKMAKNKSVTHGNNFTFDKNGHSYFFAYSGSKQGKCPKDAIKIYRGTINLKAKKKVAFKLMMNVICKPIVAKHGVQSAGYDAKSNRIYMVSNSALLSVPVSKLSKSKLKPSDVWMTQFSVNREFEGFDIDKSGTWYLLANKAPEILTKQDLAAWNLTKDLFNSKGEYIGEPLNIDPDTDDDDVIDDGGDDDYNDGEDDYIDDGEGSN